VNLGLDLLTYPQSLIADLHADGACQARLSVCAARELVDQISHAVARSFKGLCGAAFDAGAAPCAGPFGRGPRRVRGRFRDHAGKPHPWPELPSDEHAMPPDPPHTGKLSNVLVREETLEKTLIGRRNSGKGEAPVSKVMRNKEVASSLPP
jgi:hypothetical protein